MLLICSFHRVSVEHGRHLTGMPEVVARCCHQAPRTVNEAERTQGRAYLKFGCAYSVRRQARFHRPGDGALSEPMPLHLRCPILSLSYSSLCLHCHCHRHAPGPGTNFLRAWMSNCSQQQTQGECRGWDRLYSHALTGRAAPKARMAATLSRAQRREIRD